MGYNICFIILTILLLLSFRRSGGGYNEEYLSRRITGFERGFASVYIMLHHLSSYVTHHQALSVMGYVGFILVAEFFFLSGYGLMYSLDNKENYLNSFLKKRLLAVLVPYWLIDLCFILVSYFQEQTYPLGYIIVSLLGVDIVVHMWFVTVILIFYLMFWISFKICGTGEGNKGLLALSILVILYCVICFCAGIDSSRTASVGAFLFGFFFYKNKSTIEKWFRGRFYIKLSCIATAFFATFFGRLVLSYYGIGNELIHFVLRNLVSILFVTLIICIFQVVKIREDGVYCRFGDISYELYLTHITLLQLSYNFASEWWYSFAVIIASVLSAIVLKKTTALIFRRCTASRFL